MQSFEKIAKLFFHEPARIRGCTGAPMSFTLLPLAVQHMILDYLSLGDLMACRAYIFIYSSKEYLWLDVNPSMLIAS